MTNILDEIDAKIEALQAKKRDIQNACSHPAVDRANHGDSGNIMTGRESSYWTACTCQLCGKQWHENQ